MWRYQVWALGFIVSGLGFRVQGLMAEWVGGGRCNFGPLPLHSLPFPPHGTGLNLRSSRRVDLERSHHHKPAVDTIAVWRYRTGSRDDKLQPILGSGFFTRCGLRVTTTSRHRADKRLEIFPTASSCMKQ